MSTIFQTPNKMWKLNQNKISLFLRFFIVFHRLSVKCRFVAWSRGFPRKYAYCVRVKINKPSFEPFVFGSCFRTLAVILFQICCWCWCCCCWCCCCLVFFITGQRDELRNFWAYPPLPVGQCSRHCSRRSAPVGTDRCRMTDRVVGPRQVHPRSNLLTNKH